MSSTPFLTPYKRKHGTSGAGDVAFFSPKMSPVPNALETPIGNLRKEESKTVAASAVRVSNFSASHVSHTPVSSMKSDRKETSASVAFSKFSAFNENSICSYSLNGTCQASAIFLNHLAIAFRSSCNIDFRVFKEDCSDISSLHPRSYPLSISSPVIDFFFLTFPKQHLPADECRVIVASLDQLSCHHFDSQVWSDVAPVHSVSDERRCLQIFSCDGVCVGDACYIALSAALPDNSCVIQIIQFVHSQEHKWTLIQEIPIIASSTILRWRKCSSDFHDSQRKRLWFVSGDSDGFATLFECLFSCDFTLSSVSASDAYPLSSSPITSVSVSDSLVAIISSGLCAVLSVDSDASTLRPLRSLSDLVFLPVEKGSKILAASVCPDNDSVALLRRCGSGVSDFSLDVYFSLNGVSSTFQSFKYGFQPHQPRSFCGSAASLSWRCNSSGHVITACTARLLVRVVISLSLFIRLRPHHPNSGHY
jgi:hypothetical protein